MVMMAGPGLGGRNIVPLRAPSLTSTLLTPGPRKVLTAEAEERTWPEWLQVRVSWYWRGWVMSSGHSLYLVPG